jgi:hypothetical protein
VHAGMKNITMAVYEENKNGGFSWMYIVGTCKELT